jgi:hypothetical protein
MMVNDGRIPPEAVNRVRGRIRLDWGIIDGLIKTGKLLVNPRPGPPRRRKSTLLREASIVIQRHGGHGHSQAGAKPAKMQRDWDLFLLRAAKESTAEALERIGETGAA